MKIITVTITIKFKLTDNTSSILIGIYVGTRPPYAVHNENINKNKIDLMICQAKYMFVPYMYYYCYELLFLLHVI